MVVRNCAGGLPPGHSLCLSPADRTSPWIRPRCPVAPPVCPSPHPQERPGSFLLLSTPVLLEPTGLRKHHEHVHLCTYLRVWPIVSNSLTSICDPENGY